MNQEAGCHLILDLGHFSLQNCERHISVVQKLRGPWHFSYNIQGNLEGKTKDAFVWIGGATLISSSLLYLLGLELQGDRYKFKSEM